MVAGLSVWLQALICGGGSGVWLFVFGDCVLIVALLCCLGLVACGCV